MADTDAWLQSQLNIRTAVPEVWAARPVNQRPHLVLESWSVREIRGARRLVGYSVTDREGRVSSSICSIDPATARAVTSSGRVYELRGRPGADPDAENTWNSWARFNNAKNATDVTADVWRQIQDARKA